MPIKKELDNGKPTTHKIKFIDSFRLISSSLSNLVDYLQDGFHYDKCIDCMSYLDCALRCFECKKNYKKKL